jgi:CheY-like chemotaxis protein/signal transduction histidine kinase
MSAALFERLAKEPIQSGVITGFAALCSAAVINIVSEYLLGSASAPGTSGFLLAGAVSVVAGTIAGCRASAKSKVNASDLELAEKLASGDYSACIRPDDTDLSPMAFALTTIAERQLQIDTAQARLTNDASLRQEQLFSALDCVPDEVSVYDRQGILVAANKAFSRRCNTIGAVVAPGMLQSEVLNALAKSTGAALPMNERESWLKFQGEMRKDCLDTGKPVRLVRFDGTPATLFVEKTSDGNHVEIITGIAHEAEMEERALRAEREASAADRIKAVTLSRLSHTIRTPMTGVLTAAELMMKSDLDDVQRSRLDIIRRSASTLLGVVQDMFDLAADAKESAESKDQGHEYGPRRAILFAPAAGCMDAIRSQLIAEGYEVALADSVRLAAEAAAHLSASSRPVDMIVVLDLAHAGEMIAELAARITAPQPLVRLASEIAVNVEAPTVLFAVDAAEIAVAKAPVEIEILVVEDDDVNQIVFSQALQSAGHGFVIAGNGQQALDIITMRCPKLILMDVSMPGMNGIEATRRIREMTAGLAVPPVIIGMTNHFLAGDKGKCLAAGMNDYTMKPEAASILEHNIHTWLAMEPVKKAG